MNNSIIQIRFDLDHNPPQIQLCLDDGTSVYLRYKLKLRLDYILAIAKQQVSRKSALGEFEIRAILKELKVRYEDLNNSPTKADGRIEKYSSFKKIWRSDFRGLSEGRYPSAIYTLKEGEYKESSEHSDLLREFHSYNPNHRSYCLVSLECTISLPLVCDAANDVLDCRRPEHHDYRRIIEQYLDDLQADLDGPRLFMQPEHRGWLTSKLSLSQTMQQKREPANFTSKMAEVADPSEVPTIGQAHPQTLTTDIIRDLRVSDFSDRICVVGIPGSGKTTLLEQIASELARDFEASDNSSLIPIILKLAVWPEYNASESINDLSMSHFAHHCHPTLPEALLTDQCESGRLVFLLDAFDESGSACDRYKLARWLYKSFMSRPFNGCPVILTTRDSTLDQICVARFPVRTLFLKPLSEPAVRTYVKSYFRQSASKASEVLQLIRSNASIRRLVGQPETLAMVCCESSRQRITDTVDRSSLLESSICSVLFRRTNQLSREHSVRPLERKASALAALKALAWVCWSERQELAVKTDFVLRAFVEALEQDSFLSREFRDYEPGAILDSLVVHSGIVINTGNDCLMFNSMEALRLLAGQYLASLSSEVILATFNAHAWDFNWLSPLCHAASSLWRGSKEKQSLVKHIVDTLLSKTADGHDDVFSSLAQVAAHFYGSAPNDYHDWDHRASQLLTTVFEGWRTTIFNGCTAQWPYANMAIEALATHHPEKVSEQLLTVIEDSLLKIDSNLDAGFALRLLAAIDQDIHTDLILELSIKDMWPSVLGLEAIDLLGTMGVTTAVEALSDSLLQIRRPLDDSNLRSNAIVSTLQMLDPDQAANRLLSSLSDDPCRDPHVIYHLGEIRSQVVAPHLLTVLKNTKHATIHNATIEALGKLRVDTAVATLADIFVLSEEDSTHAEIITALGKIGSDEAARVLAEITITPMAGKNRTANSDAAIALRKLGSRNAVAIIRDALDSTQDSQRRDAAIALGAMCDSKAVPKLITMAHHDQSIGCRMMSLCALALIGEPNGIRVLIDTIRNNGEELEPKFVAIQALRWVNVKGSLKRDTISCLRQSLHDSSTKPLRIWAVDALGNLSAHEAAHDLMTMIDDPDSDVRRHVVWALGDIKYVPAIPDIAKLLYCEDTELVSSAMHALSQIKSIFAIDALGLRYRSADPDLQPDIVRALAATNSKWAARYLLEAVKSDNAEVRRSVVWAVRKMDLPVVDDILASLVEDEDSRVAEEAASVLSESHSAEAVVRLTKSRFRKEAAVIAWRLGYTLFADGPIAERSSLHLDIDLPLDGECCV